MLVEVLLLSGNPAQDVCVGVTAGVLPSLSRLDCDAFREGEVSGIQVARNPARGTGSLLRSFHRVVVQIIAHQDHHRSVILDLIWLKGVLDPNPVSERSVLLDPPQSILVCIRVAPKVDRRPDTVFPGEVDQPSMIAGGSCHLSSDAEVLL